MSPLVQVSGPIIRSVHQIENVNAVSAASGPCRTTRSLLDRMLRNQIGKNWILRFGGTPKFER